MEAEIKIFHCHIQLAMKNKIQWNILLSMTDELCSSFEKCLKVIHVLLDELKTYKNLQPCVVIPKKQITNEKEASDENSAMNNESTNPLEMEVKTEEMSDDVFEDSEDFRIETYPDNDEEYFDQVEESFLNILTLTKQPVRGQVSDIYFVMLGHQVVKLLNPKVEHLIKQLGTNLVFQLSLWLDQVLDELVEVSLEVVADDLIAL